MAPFPVLRGERVTLRPVREEDAGAILALLIEPSVARWWHHWDAARVRRDLLEQDEEHVLVIEVGGEVAGMLLVYEEPDEYRHAALDVTLATAHQARGLGPEALRLAIAHLRDERGHHRFTIDPAAHNENAIRAYAKLGFKPVGILRQYELGADGRWHDGLLMDLLADELG
jgi:aminoglycoside 6'-N-acetyltransferase